MLLQVVAAVEEAVEPCRFQEVWVWGIKHAGLQYLPVNVVAAVGSAIKQSTVDLTLDVSGLSVEG